MRHPPHEALAQLRRAAHAHHAQAQAVRQRAEEIDRQRLAEIAQRADQIKAAQGDSGTAGQP